MYTENEKHFLKSKLKANEIKCSAEDESLLTIRKGVYSGNGLFGCEHVNFKHILAFTHNPGNKITLRGGRSVHITPRIGIINQIINILEKNKGGLEESLWGVEGDPFEVIFYYIRYKDIDVFIHTQISTTIDCPIVPLFHLCEKLLPFYNQ